MENNNKKFNILMILSTFIIIYVLAVASDYILHLKQFSKRQVASDIITLRKQNEDRIQIEEAKKQNYVRVIFPYLYHKIPELEKKFIKDLVPLNAQPYKHVYDCNEGYGLTKYKTDRFGFRNNDLIWNEIDTTNKDKIIFIGDSYVHGSCVENKYIITNNLESFQSYNIASSGNDPYTYTALSSLFIPIVKPKYVVLIFYENDNSPDGEIFLKNLEINNIHDRYFKFENDQIYLSDEVEDIVKQVENYVINESKTRTAGSRPNILMRGIRYLTLPTIRKTLSVSYSNMFFKLPLSSKLSIDTINSLCTKHSCTPIYGFIPNSNFWEPSSSVKNYRLSIENYLAENNNYYINFSEIINNYGEKKAFAPKGTHLSKEGYKLISITIKDFIINNF